MERWLVVSTRNILKQEPPQLGSLPYKETNEGSAQDLVRGASALFSWLGSSLSYCTWACISRSLCHSWPIASTCGNTTSRLQTWQLKGAGMACTTVDGNIYKAGPRHGPTLRHEYSQKKEGRVARNYADSERADVELAVWMLHTWHEYSYTIVRQPFWSNWNWNLLPQLKQLYGRIAGDSGRVQVWAGEISRWGLWQSDSQNSNWTTMIWLSWWIFDG